MRLRRKMEKTGVVLVNTPEYTHTYIHILHIYVESEDPGLKVATNRTSPKDHLSDGVQGVEIVSGSKEVRET